MLVLLVSLATAMVCGMALGPYAGKETGEPALFRELLADIAPRTVVLADRYYCSYFLLALALLGRYDFVTRLHQCREVDFRKTQRLGKGDHLVQWLCPARADWMDQATYEQIPPSITLRLVEAQVKESGFRVDSFWVVTKLTDAHEYPREEIAELYRRRWQTGGSGNRRGFAPPTRCTPRFNGAAVFRLRKSAKEEWEKTTADALQWGRSLSTAEMSVDVPVLVRLYTLQWGRSLSTAEICTSSVFVAARSGELQWGRSLSTAEMAHIATHCWASAYSNAFERFPSSVHV